MYNPLRADSADPWPIAIVPGGPIHPRDHVGHVAEFAQLMGAIDHGQVGALCTGDRRMGKTSLLGLTSAILDNDNDTRVISVSAQTTNPAVFAERFSEALRASTWLGRERRRWALGIDVGYKGIRLRREGGYRAKAETDDLLTLVAQKAAPRRVVVIIDELVDLLSAFAADDAAHALEFLNSLQRPRQEHAVANLAVVLAGSIGLHHVVPSRKAVNDLYQIAVGPLTDDEARFLARCLFLGSGTQEKRQNGTISAVAEASGGVPFYIHHIVDRLSRLGRPVDHSDVDAVVELLLTDPLDPLHLRHYRDRLADYYGAESSLAGHILDIAALAARPVTVDDIEASLARVDVEPRPARDDLVLVIEKLELDHYLVTDKSRSRFASELLRRAWATMRKLT